MFRGRGPEDQDLEIVDVADGPGPGAHGAHPGAHGADPDDGYHHGIGPPRSPRRRLVALVGALVGLAAVVAYLVVGRVGVQRLDDEWQRLNAVTSDANETLAVLRSVELLESQPVRDDMTVLYRAQLRALESIRHDVAATTVLDPGIRHLRSTMERALRLHAQLATLQSDNIHSNQVSPSLMSVQDATDKARAEVNESLNAQRHRWHVDENTSGRNARLRVLDARLSQLRRVADHPTGTTLLISIQGGDIVRLDIDHSRTATAHAGGDYVPWLIPRQGYVAFVRQEGEGPPSLWALPDGDRETPREIGPLANAIPSVRDDAIWVYQYGQPLVREIDGFGHTLSSPPPLPRGHMPVAAVDDGLVLVQPTQSEGEEFTSPPIELWNPATGATRPLGTGTVLGAHGSLIVYTLCDLPNGSCTLWLLDVHTGEKRLVPTAYALGPSVLIAFSPDGSSIAIAFTDFDQGGRKRAIGMIDVRTTRTAIVPGSSGEDGGSLTWSRSGWIFFLGHDTNLGLIYAYDSHHPERPATPLRTRRLVNDEPVAVLARP